MSKNRIKKQYKSPCPECGELLFTTEDEAKDFLTPDYEDDDEKYLNEVIYDILYDEYEGEDEFDYSAVTPEKKLDVFVKYIIEQMEEGVDYQSHYWVELS